MRPAKPVPFKKIFFKIIRRYFHSFNSFLDSIPDPRCQDKLIYPLKYIFWVSIFAFVFKLESRRRINFLFNNPFFIKNLSLFLSLNISRLSHSDTVNNLILRLNVSVLNDARYNMIYTLIRSKALDKFRIMKNFILVIDGTSYVSFKRKHCEKCIKVKLTNSEYEYRHNVVEAKFVFENGLSLSVDSEVIVDSEKKRSEIKAAEITMRRIKRKFKNLNITVSLDGLYGNENIIKLCKKFRWNYVISLKEKRLTQIYEEYKSLKENYYKKENSIMEGKIYYENGIEWRGEEIGVVEYNDKKKGLKFLWISNYLLNKYTVGEIVRIGRLRWKIENEGFNVEKNLGYNLTHPFSKSLKGLKRWYIIMQIAHNLCQIVEKSNLIAKIKINYFWSNYDIWIELFIEFRSEIINLAEIDKWQVYIGIDTS